MNCGPLGSSVHGILQARILEWVAVPSPGDLPDPGIEPASLALTPDSLPQGSPFIPQKLANLFPGFFLTLSHETFSTIRTVSP